MLIIAKKEFVDLLSNRMVLIVLIAFLVDVIFTVYDFYCVLNGLRPGRPMFYENTGIAADFSIFYTTSLFGTVIGIIIGCSTISSERMGNALNTLIVKPVYRDTIINGKILGTLTFLAIVILFYIAIFTSGFLVLCGNALAPSLFDYFSRLPFVFLFIMVFIGVFLSISVLISLLVQDQSFAMIISVLTVYLSMMMFTPFPSNLNNLFPGSGLDSLCMSLSPNAILWQVQGRFMDTHIGAYDAFINILPEFTRLLLYVVIAMVSSYIVFVRRDIS